MIHSNCVHVGLMEKAGRPGCGLGGGGDVALVSASPCPPTLTPLNCGHPRAVINSWESSEVSNCQDSDVLPPSGAETRQVGEAWR